MAIRGIDVEMDLRMGHPADKVVRLAQERGVSLVVMGGTGGGSEQEGPGSVSDLVLKRCQSAVLLVR
jgi:nucleotide-binding universal stress UspA family protein